MEVLGDKEALATWRRAQRELGRTVALVPTMGALHAGHLSLIATAKAHADVVVASIYVNPTQFDRADDLAAYPRDAAADRAMLVSAGCDAVFEPQTMYGPHHATWVELPELAATLCGAYRPGHFRGVATVVTKFLNMATPDVAVFGEKDFQQIQIIRRCVADLDIATKIIGAPTIREADGLAMSSRNRRLSAPGREAATAISRGLRAAQAAFSAGMTTVGPLRDGIRGAIRDAGGEVEYVELVRPVDLQPVADREEAPLDGVIAVAAYFDGVRLIDNMALSPA